AVTQRCVEDQYSIWVSVLGHCHSLLVSRSASSRAGVRLHAAAGALFPPKGEKKKSQVETERHRVESISDARNCNKSVPVGDDPPLKADHPEEMTSCNRTTVNKQPATGGTCYVVPVIASTARHVP